MLFSVQRTAWLLGLWERCSSSRSVGLERGGLGWRPRDDPSARPAPQGRDPRSRRIALIGVFWGSMRPAATPLLDEMRRELSQVRCDGDNIDAAPLGQRHGAAPLSREGADGQARARTKARPRARVRLRWCCRSQPALEPRLRQRPASSGHRFRVLNIVNGITRECRRAVVDT